MAMVTKAVTAKDQGKFISDSLIANTELMLRLTQFAESRPLPQGNGDTAWFVQYQRTDVVVDRLQEGVTPDSTAFTVTDYSVKTDQYGMYITLTDVVEVTTKHPVLQQALRLLADSISRTKEHQIAEVLNRHTNVYYWDGSRADRGGITSTDYFKAEIVFRVKATMTGQGARYRKNGMLVAVMDTYVEGDIFSDTSSTSSYTTAQVQGGNLKDLAKGYFKTWLGVEWIESNFMPVFTRLTGLSAPAAGAGGTLSGTVYHKITRKSLSRGFEEEIAVEASTAMGGNNRLAFTTPATLGYVYNIYAGSATGDANLYLVAENVKPSTVYNLDALVGSGLNPPQTPAAGVRVHVLYFFGAECLDHVALDGASMEGTITPKGTSDTDPLGQRRHVGTKYYDKNAVREPVALVRVELASRFG